MVKENSDKIILDLCGGTGAWSKPYKEAGYDVRLITLPEYNVRTYEPPENVYGILAAPPCTMFAFSRTKAKKPRDLREGMECVRACLDIIWKMQEVKQDTARKITTLKFWALENPYYGFLKYFLGKPAFIFDPWEFGDGYQKKTALWGYFNEPIKNPVPMSEEIKKLAKTNSYLHKIPIEKGNRHLLNALKQKYPKFGSDKDISFRFNAAVKSITPAGFAKAFYEANK